MSLVQRAGKCKLFSLGSSLFKKKKKTQLFILYWDSSAGKEPTRKCRRPGFTPWVGKICWRREWLPSPVFWPGEFHGQRNWQATVHGVTKSQTWLSHSLSFSLFLSLSLSHTHTHTHVHIVVIASAEQWRDSAIHNYVSILSQTPLPSRLPCNTEQISLCRTVGPCWSSILNIAECTCRSQTP